MWEMQNTLGGWRSNIRQRIQAMKGVLLSQPLQWATREKSHGETQGTTTK